MGRAPSRVDPRYCITQNYDRGIPKAQLAGVYHLRSKYYTHTSFLTAGKEKGAS